MKHIVITGSTRGIGYGMAEEFLLAGCRVIINGRTEDSVQQALASLEKIASGQADGMAARVDSREDLERLWDYASAKFGKIDIWINNAGIDQEKKYFWELGQKEYEQVIQTNLLGTFHGSHVAFNGMLRQGFGQIFNMEGFGSNGMMREKLTIYGTSKSAISYFTRSLAIEAEKTNIKVGVLSPGMVATDLLRKSLNEKNRKIYNILGDKVGPVAYFLVKEILKNDKNNANIRWLTGPKVMGRFIKSVFRKRDIFQ